MARSIELLLLNNVENLGIVGDLVAVKPGYARNFLLPHQLAEYPTAEKIESLKEARQKALAELASARKHREEVLSRMADVAVSVVRSCNDQGVLYGSISQRDIADALLAAGFPVDTRAIRLGETIRRIGSYHVPIQLDRDLRTEITVTVQPDRQLEQEMRTPEPAPAAAEASAEGDDAGAERKGGKPKSDAKPSAKPEGKPEAKAEKSAKKPAKE